MGWICRECGTENDFAVERCRACGCVVTPAFLRREEQQAQKELREYRKRRDRRDRFMVRSTQNLRRVSRALSAGVALAVLVFGGLSMPKGPFVLNPQARYVYEEALPRLAQSPAARWEALQAHMIELSADVDSAPSGGPVDGIARRISVRAQARPDSLAARWTAGAAPLGTPSQNLTVLSVKLEALKLRARFRGDVFLERLRAIDSPQTFFQSLIHALRPDMDLE